MVSAEDVKNDKKLNMTPLHGEIQQSVFVLVDDWENLCERI